MKEILVVGGGAAGIAAALSAAEAGGRVTILEGLQPAREKTARYWERAVQSGQYPDCAGMLSHGAARSVEKCC